MSIEFIFRIIGMGVLGVAGLRLGAIFADMAGDKAVPTIWAGVFALVGALLGLVVTPYLTTRPARILRVAIGQMPVSKLVSALVGLIVGLVIAALLAFPLSLLPSPFSEILPFVGVTVFSWLGVSIFMMRQSDLFTLFLSRVTASTTDSRANGNASSVLVDTSAIIDGRMADISKTGFIGGTMLVPRFVLNELQHVADSADVLRRNRGRRGLEILNKLQKDAIVPVRITDMDVDGVHEVDDKLVILAKQLHCSVLTNDYNLNRVAEIQGVSVLNINELANAVKAVFLPGETMNVEVIQEGKEHGQGVGYLDDGTMVVVEDGRHHLRSHLNVVVTKMLQTAAGRMIFARPETSN